MKRTFSIAAILFLAFSIASNACAVTVTPANKIVSVDVFARVNDVRRTNGLAPLTQNASLQAVAQAKANDMARRSWFSHTSPEGTYVWPQIKASGYAYTMAGENLAVAFSDSSSTVAAWVASPSHLKNIVNPRFKEEGIGIAVGTFEGYPNIIYVVQLFGQPREKAVVQATVRPLRNVCCAQRP